MMYKTSTNYQLIEDHRKLLDEIKATVSDEFTKFILDVRYNHKMEIESNELDFTYKFIKVPAKFNNFIWSNFNNWYSLSKYEKSKYFKNLNFTGRIEALNVDNCKLSKSELFTEMLSCSNKIMQLLKFNLEAEYEYSCINGKYTVSKVTATSWIHSKVLKSIIGTTSNTSKNYHYPEVLAFLNFCKLIEFHSNHINDNENPSNNKCTTYQVNKNLLDELLNANFGWKFVPSTIGPILPKNKVERNIVLNILKYLPTTEQYHRALTTESEYNDICAYYRSKGWNRSGNPDITGLSKDDADKLIAFKKKKDEIYDILHSKSVIAEIIIVMAECNYDKLVCIVRDNFAKRYYHAITRICHDDKLRLSDGLGATLKEYDIHANQFTSLFELASKYKLGQCFEIKSKYKTAREFIDNNRELVNRFSYDKLFIDRLYSFTPNQLEDWKTRVNMIDNLIADIRKTDNDFYYYLYRNTHNGNKCTKEQRKEFKTVCLRWLNNGHTTNWYIKRRFIEEVDCEEVLQITFFLNKVCPVLNWYLERCKTDPKNFRLEINKYGNEELVYNKYACRQMMKIEVRKFTSLMAYLDDKVRFIPNHDCILISQEYFEDNGKVVNVKEFMKEWARKRFPFLIKDICCEEISVEQINDELKWSKINANKIIA